MQYCDTQAHPSLTGGVLKPTGLFAHAHSIYRECLDSHQNPWAASLPAHWPACTLCHLPFALPPKNRVHTCTAKTYYSYHKHVNAKKPTRHNTLWCRFWTWITAISRSSHHGWVNSANCDIWAWRQRPRASKGMNPS